MRNESASVSVYIHTDGIDLGQGYETESAARDVRLSYADMIRLTEALEYLEGELNTLRFPTGDLVELRERLEREIDDIERVEA